MRVGFVLRSTEIKPLFHRFVQLKNNSFSNYFHMRLSTSPLLWDATGVVEHVVLPGALVGTPLFLCPAIHSYEHTGRLHFSTQFDSAST